MSEREEVLREFQRTSKSVMGEPTASFVDRDAMADEIVRLRSALTTAERERDEARRERDALRVTNAEDMPIAVRNIGEIIAENHRLRHRAERSERVVAAAKAYLNEWDSDGFECVAHVALIDALRAFVSEEGTNA